MNNFDIPVTEEPVTKSSRRSGIMLCYPFEEKRLATWKKPYIIQPKLDGVRCRALIKDGNVVLISSEGHLIEQVPHINTFLSMTFLEDNLELDGELYLHGMDFQDIISRTSRTKNKHVDSEKIEYHIFDMIDNKPQVDRLAELNRLGFWIGDKDGPIRIVSPSIVRDMDEIMEFYQKYLDDGYEGFVIRDAYSAYQRKRFTGMMKFKPHQRDAYVIAGYSNEVSIGGDVKDDVLGRIICMSDPGLPWLGELSPFVKPPEGYFGVGTGFTYDQRIEYWRDRESLYCKLLKVKYQSLTQGKGVPRFPVFLEVIGE